MKSPRVPDEPRPGNPGNALDGRGRQPCCKVPCGYRSLRGIRKGEGLCPYHWAVVVWGQAWGDSCFPGWKPKTERGAL